MLVGHVTKDGALAGPRVLEHLVDTVITVEGDRHHALRMVRATKHRFGPTGELGLFAMGDAGLAAVTDPHQLLLGDRRPGTPGSAVLPAMEGQRALLVEIQALRAPGASVGPAPSIGPGRRRRAPGPAPGRPRATRRSVARAHRRLRLGRGRHPGDGAGGRSGPGSGPGLHRGRTTPAGRPVAFGEVGLGGEIRQVPHAPRRLSEAARIGFRRAFVPASCPDGPPGHRTRPRASVVQAVLVALSSTAAGDGGPGSFPPRRRTAESTVRPVLHGYHAQVERTNAAVAGALALVAPGQPLRDGLERVLLANRGALIVVGDDADVLSICTGDFSSTPNSRPNGCRSWPSWTGPSSCRPTPPASPGPTSTSCPTRPSPRRRREPVTARPSVWPGRSTSPSSRCRPPWASSPSTGDDAKHVLQSASRLHERVGQALQTLRALPPTPRRRRRQRCRRWRCTTPSPCAT